jgi:hypothetical protein
MAAWLSQNMDGIGASMTRAGQGFFSTEIDDKYDLILTGNTSPARVFLG